MLAKSTATVQPARVAKPTAGLIQREPFSDTIQTTDDRVQTLEELDILSFFRLRATSNTWKTRIDQLLDRWLPGIAPILPEILKLLNLEVRRQMKMDDVFTLLRFRANLFTEHPEQVLLVLQQMHLSGERFDSLHALFDGVTANVYPSVNGEAHKVLNIIGFAQRDLRAIQAGHLPQHSRTLQKMAHHYGEGFLQNRAVQVLQRVIQRQQQRLAQLAAGEQINLSELFHATSPDYLLAIATSGIEPRMERDKKPFKGAYVGPSPTLYGGGTFGFPGRMKDEREYHHEPLDQSDGNYGLKQGIQLNALHKEIWDYVTKYAFEVLKTPEKVLDELKSKLAEHIRLAYEGGQWVLNSTINGAEVPSGYFAGNMIGKAYDACGITRPEADQLEQAGEMLLEALAHLRRNDINQPGSVRGANIIAPEAADHDFWKKESGKPMSTLEDIHGQFEKIGLALDEGEFIGLTDTMIELDYMHLF